MLSCISSPRKSVLRERAAGYWGRCLKAALSILWVSIAAVSGIENNTSWGSFYSVDNIDARENVYELGKIVKKLKAQRFFSPAFPHGPINKSEMGNDIELSEYSEYARPGLCSSVHFVI